MKALHPTELSGGPGIPTSARSRTAADGISGSDSSEAVTCEAVALYFGLQVTSCKDLGLILFFF